MAAGFAVAQRCDFHIHTGRHAQSLNLSEIPLVAGLIMSTPEQLVAALVLGTAVYGVARRQPPVKLLFNVVQAASEACVALVVYRGVLGPAALLSPRGWLAAFAAALSADLWSHAAVLLAISLANGHVRGRMRSLATAQARIPPFVSTGFALIGAYVTFENPAGAWLLLLPVAVFFAGYRRQAALREQYANLEALYDFTRHVGSALEDANVAHALLHRAAALLRADRAELVIFGSGGHTVSTSVRSGNPSGMVTTTAALDRLPPQVVVFGQSLLVGRHTREPQLLAELERRGARELMMTPVRAGEELIGVLVVTDRLDHVSTFSSNDLRLFEALANHASVALRNDRLVAALRQEAADKEYRSLHDPLTGLANRTTFLDSVQRRLETHWGRGLAVMLIDLDRFKEVNDTLGHSNGDLLLGEVGSRLRRTVGSAGTVSRLGGDEFAVWLPTRGGATEAVELAERVGCALREPFELEGLPIEVSGSVGVAIHPGDGDDASTLLRCADVAMYVAKQGHRGVAVYTAEQNHYSPRRLAVVGELRRAIEDGTLTIYYQPVASLRTGRIVGCEALVRWVHPRYGLLPPEDFVPVAEHTGLVHTMTRLVLGSALEQIRDWRGRGADLGVAVNVSARTLLEPGFVDTVAGLLASTGVPSSLLTLELTESSVMDDVESSMGTLGRLSDLGVSLAVDDFGTGYSSLSYLSRLPVDMVKIDKSFVQHMASDAGDAMIVRSTIDLARNLGLEVVAEGVEDRVAWERLKGLEADYAQGYLVSKPLPPQRFLDWLLAYGGELRTGRATRPAAGAAGLVVITNEDREEKRLRPNA